MMMGFCHFKNYTTSPRRWNDSAVLKYLVHVLNTEGWFRYEKDSELTGKGIEELFDFYKLGTRTGTGGNLFSRRDL